jgi:hypothetical protein
VSEYFTLDTVRDELLKIGELGRTSILGTFPQDWQYCPCFIIDKCTKLNNKVCSVPIKVGVFISDPNIGLTIIEIIYARETKKGYVRANNMKLRQLLEKKLINENSLEKISFAA